MAGAFVLVLLLVLLFVAVRPRRRAVPMEPKRPEEQMPGVKVTLSVGRGLTTKEPERSWAPPHQASPGVWSINPDLR